MVGKSIIIMGTNCTGKTTLIRSIIDKFGGIERTEQNITYLKSRNPKIGIAGKYDGLKYGGVDGLGCTRVLPSIMECILTSCDVAIAEGVKLGRFGINIQRSLFCANTPIVVCLYAPIQTIAERLAARSCGKITKRIALDNRGIIRAAEKYKSIGVKTLFFDTSKVKTEDIVEQLNCIING